MAKGIEKVIEKFAVQTCLYWKNNGVNGMGGYNFDLPIEIKCRWDGKSEIKINNTGAYFSSAASVLTNYEVKEGDFLMLAKLSDFPVGADLSNPIAILGAYSIIQLDKIPMVRKTDEFVRTAYLFDYGK